MISVDVTATVIVNVVFQLRKLYSVPTTSRAGFLQGRRTHKIQAVSKRQHENHIGPVKNKRSGVKSFTRPVF